MRRVLVIEDDDQMRAMIRQMLERVGYQVSEAGNGEAAVRAFEGQRADVAVVDLFLPERNGWETIHALQRLAPELPFVIVSGGGALESVKRGSTGTLDEAQRRGVVRVLRKPFDWNALTAAVGELMEHERTPEGCR